MRPGGPRPPGGVVRPAAPPPPPEANEIRVTKDTSKAHVKKETPECIDLDDDDSPPPPPRSATLDKLSHLGISVSRQKAPQVPKSVQARLPPGISLSHTGSSGSPSKRPAASGSASFTMTPAQDEPPPKRVALPDNVAGALASVNSSPASASKKKVELELSDAQINALKALGML